MLSVTCKPYMLSVVMLNVVMLSAVMQSVAAPTFQPKDYAVLNIMALVWR